MAELKTKRTGDSVNAFLARLDEPRRRDCEALVALMEGVTRSKAEMWGPTMVGFGKYHYVYDSGREGDWFLCGFSPRKQALTLYIMAGFDRHEELMQRLGKYRTGKSCLYLKSLDDVDGKVLKQLVTESVRYMKQRYR